MTLQEIKTLHAYNSWATALLFEALASMPPDQYLRDLHTSHGSIHGTLTHIVGGQKIWLSRWTGAAESGMLSVADVPGLAELKAAWEEVGLNTAKFLGGMTDRKLQDTFTMTTSKGAQYTHTYSQAFQHMVNHSSFHRGQIVTLMRQLGARPPDTGLIRFYRETASRP